MLAGNQLVCRDTLTIVLIILHIHTTKITPKGFKPKLQLLFFCIIRKINYRITERLMNQCWCCRTFIASKTKNFSSQLNMTHPRTRLHLTQIQHASHVRLFVRATSDLVSNERAHHADLDMSQCANLAASGYVIPLHSDAPSPLKWQQAPGWSSW